MSTWIYSKPSKPSNRVEIPKCPISNINASDVSLIEFPSCLLDLTPNLSDSFSTTAVSLFFPENAELLRATNGTVSFYHFCNAGVKSQEFQHVFVFVCLYTYLSSRMWHSYFAKSSDTPLVEHIGLDYSPFFEGLRDSWIDQFIEAFHPAVGDLFVHVECHNQKELTRNELMPTVHPLDLFRLTSFVLKLSPCRLVNQGARLLSEPTRITIIDRSNDRMIQNIKNVRQTLRRRWGRSKEITVKVFHLEGLSMLEQARIMEATDVLLLAHGAAMTNAVFLSPCAVILEILPYGYNAEDYFRTKFSTHFKIIQLRAAEHRASLTESCQEQIQPAEINNSCIDNSCATNHPAMRTYIGRQCLGKQNVAISRKDVVDKISEALAYRKQCIANNLMY
mmetsp:Transcript_56917/g.112110  ORF Transcript_56917/g.112110 Transcript_56917/m.112110 type:complete len:392 (+) Transcript_56917:94-1269(+)